MIAAWRRGDAILAAPVLGRAIAHGVGAALVRPDFPLLYFERAPLLELESELDFATAFGLERALYFATALAHDQNLRAAIELLLPFEDAQYLEDQV